MKNSNFDIDEIIAKGKIDTEVELEHAMSAYKKLRLLIKDHPGLKSKRRKVSKLIHDYEAENWSRSAKISNSQIKESDEAEMLVEEKDKFISTRREIIKSKLSKLNLNQQEFGKILGHNSKSYMSELMTGVRSFSLKDLILISNLLKINLNDLVFRSIPMNERRKIEKAIQNLDKPKLKLSKREFAFNY